jgi:hypothetical protein
VAQSLPGVTIYTSDLDFEKVARYFEERLQKEKHVFCTREESDGQPCFVAGAGVRFTGGAWATIVVTPQRPRGRRPPKGTQILVTERAATPAKPA